MNPLQNLRLGEDFSLFEEYAGDLREKECVCVCLQFFFVSWKEISYKNEDEGFLVALT